MRGDNPEACVAQTTARSAPGSGMHGAYMRMMTATTTDSVRSTTLRVSDAAKRRPLHARVRPHHVAHSWCEDPKP